MDSDAETAVVMALFEWAVGRSRDVGGVADRLDVVDTTAVIA